VHGVRKEEKGQQKEQGNRRKEQKGQQKEEKEQQKGQQKEQIHTCEDAMNDTAAAVRGVVAARLCTAAAPAHLAGVTTPVERFWLVRVGLMQRTDGGKVELVRVLPQQINFINRRIGRQAFLKP
jgi:hypothetical protein